MKYEIIGREIEITEAMKQHIADKLSVIEKYYIIKPDTKARIVCKVHKNDQKVEITIPTDTVLLRSEVYHDDWYAAVDLAIDKLEGQIRKVKTRYDKKKRKASFAENYEAQYQEVDNAADNVQREKDIYLEELDVDKAIEQMELLGHDFFAYKEIDTEYPCILYRRKDGYGILHLK